VVTHAGPIYFGGVAGGYDSFWGRLDEIQLRTNALSAEQISLRGLWRFDEGGGSVLADGGAEGHDGILVDPAARVPGRSGLGLDLSTGQAVIRNIDNSILPASGGAFSVSFWLQPTAPLTGRNAVMQCGDGATRGWLLTVESDLAGDSRLHLESGRGGGTL